MNTVTLGIIKHIAGVVISQHLQKPILEASEASLRLLTLLMFFSSFEKDD